MDTILYNGKIYTQDKAYPHCSAIAIKNGVIAAMGNDDEILALSDGSTEKLDLNKRRVLPGFEGKNSMGKAKRQMDTGSFFQSG